MTIKEKIKHWGSKLELLEGMERLEYLVELADYKTSLPREQRTDDKLVFGCISRIWVNPTVQNDKVIVDYDSDSMITKGITRIVCDCFTGGDVAEAVAIHRDEFNDLRIKELLTAQRRNGLGNLIETIQKKVIELNKAKQTV
tara:strand:+ start:104 stop:529 length:426 start_codon:yes stop_codon:yes gene_type:complete